MNYVILLHILETQRGCRNLKLSVPFWSSKITQSSKYK